MNEIQKHLIKMLQEIDEICVKNDIPYLLCGRNAKDACQSHHFLGEYVYASIMMRGQDFNKFRKLVAKKKGRAVESILENPDFPAGMSMRYVDETTTFIYGHLSHNFKHKGIYITIQNCRKIPKSKYKRKLANGIDKLIAYAGSGDKAAFGKKMRLLCSMMDLGCKLFGKPFVIRRLVNRYEKLTATGGKNLAYVRPMKANIKIPASMFTSVKRVELEGSGFLVPSDTGLYLEKVYGKSWKTDKKKENISSRHLLVASTQVSYKDVDTDDSLYANRGEVNEIIEKRKTLTEQIKHLRGKIEAYWDLLFLTKERYRLYRLYMPVVEILQERLANREYGWLNIAMKDYVQTVKKYLPKELPIMVCPELDDLALEMLYYSGDLAAAKTFKKLKKSVALKSINMELDQRALEEALANLPATISCDEENNVPAFLRCGEQLHEVVRLDDDGQAHPLLLKEASKIVPAPIEGDKPSVWQLAAQMEDGTYVPLFGSEWGKQLFETERVVPLIQHIYGQDLELTWLAEDGRLYIAAGFESYNRYKSVSMPTYCAVREDMEVPVSFFDEESETMRALFCLNDNGERLPVITLGVAGSLWVTPGAANGLYYRNDADETVRLSVSRFADEATEDVKQVFYQEAKPEICCKLVQEDAFGRILEVAALYDDESIMPLARMNADGTLSKMEPQKQNYATLCLAQKDGSTITLAVVDSEGNVTSALPDGQSLPIGSIIGSAQG